MSNMTPSRPLAAATVTSSAVPTKMYLSGSARTCARKDASTLSASPVLVGPQATFSETRFAPDSTYRFSGSRDADVFSGRQACCSQTSASLCTRAASSVAVAIGPPKYDVMLYGCASGLYGVRDRAALGCFERAWHSTLVEPLRTSLRPSLREEARRVIRAGLITGELAAGEIFSAPSLAQKLGVSATPVREALLDLAGEGLLEPVRNRGFRVLALEDKDLDEIFEFRALLEVPLVGRVAGRLTEQEVAKLTVFLEALEAAAEDGDLVAYLTADQDFHTALLEPIQNRRLSDAVSNLRDQQRLYGLPRIVNSESFLETAREHRDIFDAVLEGNSELAQALMYQHLHHTRGVWAGLVETRDATQTRTGG